MVGCWQEAGLCDTLGALKSYFLLARGDLFTTFAYVAEAELDKNASEVTLTRLQSLLELGDPVHARFGAPQFCR